MVIQTYIRHTILLALAMLVAGCASPPRTDSSVQRGLSFSLVAPDARAVSIAGTFNRWDPNSHPLSGPARNGRWTINVVLPPGRYEYLFVINGDSWVLDPSAPSVDNGLGERNSVVTVTSDHEGAP